MQPHPHNDRPYDRRQPPHFQSSASSNQHLPLLPPPDSLLAGAPSYAHSPPQDPRYHGTRTVTHPMAPPPGSAYRPQHPRHSQDQFHQQDPFYQQDQFHQQYPPQPHAHHQSAFAAQEPQAPQQFSRAPETQTRVPLQTAHKATTSSWVPNLLGQDRELSLDTMVFGLDVRQQPRAARACGFGDRDRRVIDPPPIVQLKFDGPSLSEEEKRTYLRFPSYVMNCSIWDETGTRDASYMPDEYNHQRRLMGSLVGTPFVGDDDRGEEGCFFCFSDLSCRTPGAFRLKFTLIMIDPGRASSLRHFPILAEVTTDIFQVFSAKEFPGMVASSALAKKLKEQGCIISIKKGNDRVRRGGDGRSDDEDD